MLKSFSELYKLDISNLIQKKPVFKKEGDKFVPVQDKSKWLDYLEWSTVLVLLHENGAEEVSYGVRKNSEGYPAFFMNGKSPFVCVWVTIDGKTFEYDFPVIDGNKVPNIPDQLEIHKAQQRGFVKCVAVHTGLGLKLWQKDDVLAPADEEEKTKPKKLLPFPKDDQAKWNATVKWLKGKGTIERLKETYDIDDDTQFNLIIATEANA